MSTFYVVRPPVRLAPLKRLEEYARLAADRIFARSGCVSDTWVSQFNYEVNQAVLYEHFPPVEFAQAIRRYLAPRCPCGVGRRATAGCVQGG